MPIKSGVGLLTHSKYVNGHMTSQLYSEGIASKEERLSNSALLIVDRQCLLTWEFGIRGLAIIPALDRVPPS